MTFFYLAKFPVWNWVYNELVLLLQDEAETAQGEGCDEDDGGLSVSTSEGHEGAPANLRGVRRGDDDMERGEGPQDPQDPPSGAARPSVSNENNILLDPEVLTDHVTQVGLKVVSMPKFSAVGLTRLR